MKGSITVFHVPNADNRFDRYNCLVVVSDMGRRNGAQANDPAAHHHHSPYPPPCPCQRESGDMVEAALAYPLPIASVLQPKRGDEL